MKLQLRHDTGFVVLRCPRRYPQIRRYFLRGLTLRKQLQYFPLPGGQYTQVFDLIDCIVAAFEPTGNLVRYVPLPCKDGLQRLEQLLARRMLEHIPHRPLTQRFGCVGHILVHR